MSHRHGNPNGALSNLTESSVYLAFKLIALLVFANATLSCPLNCECDSKSGYARCRSLREIPEEILSWVQNLTIINSDISVLRSSGFQRMGTSLDNLTTLVLAKGNVQVIEAKAFLYLSNLTTLDLSFNALRSISNDAFEGLTQLQVLKMNQALQEPARSQISNSGWLEHLQGLQTLELNSNELQSIPLAIKNLENLQTVFLRNNSISRLSVEEVSVLQDRKAGVYLSPNPIVCDCRIQEMIFWLQNTSQASDAQQLHCYSPLTLNGTLVTKLRGDNLKCINEDLETASYVFFGIVLALIGVIFLMVLYLNRRGIKRWMNNFREACRDQMEGYHYRYEQDSDPRRSNASTGI
ncbi:trophoblast glycoprotein-like [Gastrophryne carolinensis]